MVQVADEQGDPGGRVRGQPPGEVDAADVGRRDVQAAVAGRDGDLLVEELELEGAAVDALDLDGIEKEML